ncbi:unknown [Clostridium sp. CAG:628]|nr:unknown [Clostridium sp. CAG:628]
MNNNFEAIKSLVSLLVKKSGFDIDKNYSEEELAKTKENIQKLQSEKESSNNQKTLGKIIDTLKLRQANWENNAEIVGKSLLNAYKEGKDYSQVKARIELLGNLAYKGTENLSAGNLYSKLSELESKYNELNNKIDTYEYKNTEEREMDEKYKSYLDNKISSLNDEIKIVNKELDELRDIELKDVTIVNKIKEYIDKLDNDLARIDRILNESANMDISFEVYERLESAKEELESKQIRNKDTLEKAEKMLENVRINRTNSNSKKEILEEEFDKCTIKKNNISTKLKEDNYINTTERIIDINEKEKIRVELDYLNNKKDVIYVDAIKVKDELIREWSTKKENFVERTNNYKEEIIKEQEEKNVDKVEVVNNKPVIEENEILRNEELILEEKPEYKEIEEEKEITSEEKKNNNRIELDW